MNGNWDTYEPADYDDEEWPDYSEEGPYCMHWGDPNDCDEICPDCFHQCNVHSPFVGCLEDGCFCKRG